MQYASWVFNMFDIPMSMMPTIVDSCGDHFGSTKQGKVVSFLNKETQFLVFQVCLDPQSPSEQCWQTSLPRSLVLDATEQVPPRSRWGLDPSLTWSPPAPTPLSMASFLWLDGRLVWILASWQREVFMTLGLLWSGAKTKDFMRNRTWSLDFSKTEFVAIVLISWNLKPKKSD